MYIEAQLANTDISEHLPTLRLLASLCDQVVEFGVRSGVSTAAIISSGTPSIHYDILPQPYEFPYGHTFIQASTLEIEIPTVDMLFIDSEHSYVQLSQELKLHAHKVRRFIAFHDTTTYADALIPAINEFLKANSRWFVLAQYLNNNGLTVISRDLFFGQRLPLIHRQQNGSVVFA